MTDISKLSFKELQQLEKQIEERKELLKQSKDCIEGFLLGPTALYNRKSIEAKTYKVEGENFDEIVKFVKELKENNEMVFLYEVSYTPGRTETLVVEKKHGSTNYTETYPQSVALYKVRYGVVNNDIENS